GVNVAPSSGSIAPPRPSDPNLAPAPITPRSSSSGGESAVTLSAAAFEAAEARKRRTKLIVAGGALLVVTAALVPVGWMATHREPKPAGSVEPPADSPIKLT